MKRSVRAAATVHAAISAVLDADTDNFVALAALAGLDPATSFRNRDLRGVDFSDCDLSGFDFTNSDLRGCLFVESRIFGAKFEGADVSIAALTRALDFRKLQKSVLRPMQPRGEPASFGEAIILCDWIERSDTRQIERDLTRRLDIICAFNTRDFREAKDMAEQLLSLWSTLLARSRDLGKHTTQVADAALRHANVFRNGRPRAWRGETNVTADFETRFLSACGLITRYKPTSRGYDRADLVIDGLSPILARQAIQATTAAALLGLVKIADAAAVLLDDPLTFAMDDGWVEQAQFAVALAAAGLQESGRAHLQSALEGFDRAEHMPTIRTLEKLAYSILGCFGQEQALPMADMFCKAAARMKSPPLGNLISLGARFQRSRSGGVTFAHHVWRWVAFALAADEIQTGFQLHAIALLLDTSATQSNKWKIRLIERASNLVGLESDVSWTAYETIATAAMEHDGFDGLAHLCMSNVLSIREALEPGPRVRLLNKAAKLERRLGDIAQAIAYASEAVRVAERELGSDHPNTRAARKEFIDLRFIQKRSDRH